eukprot:TRINITY_DN1451_c0_g1_i1.p1 TRINITY_DN1451_c0_g1~~TRINITY_DN1451_c0_g1_i1.p1  ORF type:complete len:771 (+),score=130.36 TRINITY_DN1451_c0_g1_i1:2961-5273(+)
MLLINNKRQTNYKYKMWGKNKKEDSDSSEQYDDNTDLYFGPQKRKRLSKEEQIYGIFGATEAEPEPDFEEKNILGNPLSFVRSKKESEFKTSNRLKIIHGDQDPELEEEKFRDDQNVEYIGDTAVNKSTVLDQERRAAHPGLSAHIPHPDIKERAAKFSFGKPRAPQHKLPKEFGVRTTDEALADARNKQQHRKEEEIYKERYGKGFNILKNVGFTPGSTIGKTVTGIAEPIIPQKRPEKMGLNFGGFEEHSRKEKTQAKSVFINVAEEEERVKRWKVDPEKREAKRLEKEEKQKIKREYQAYKKELDIIHFNKTLVKNKPMTIIDMTGPEAAIVADIRDITAKPEKPKEGYLNKIKSYIKFYLEQCRYAKQTVFSSVEEAANNLGNYEYEAKVLKEDLVLSGKDLNQYKKFTELYMEISQRWEVAGIETIFKGFKELFDVNKGLYEECGLPELSANLILGKIRREFIRWRIDKGDSGKYYKIMESIQNFFKETIPQPSGEEEEEMRASYNITSPEETLQKYMIYFLLILEEAWVPIVVSFINNEWDPKESDILLEFIELWSKIVPREVMLLLYETSIAPRIRSAVETWDPFTDPIPIHIWVHPWLPILGLSALTPAIEAFSEKIIAALKNWSPEDESAKALLEPWKPVMNEKTWSNIMRRCIIPKLTYAIKQLDINPANQKIEPLKQLFSWMGLVDTIDIIQIMKDFFFPKWVGVLDKWIQKEPNKKEVYIWYTGWKEFIPKVVAEEPSIQKYFAEALRLIQQQLIRQI